MITRDKTLDDRIQGEKLGAIDFVEKFDWRILGQATIILSDLR